MRPEQFFLGLVAIFIATVVYRWQKTVDRETAVQSEVRALYAKYLAISQSSYLSNSFFEPSVQEQSVPPSDDDIVKRMHILYKEDIEVKILADQIMLLAPMDVVLATQQFHTRLVSFRKNVASNLELLKDKGKEHTANMSEEVDALNAEYHTLLLTMRGSLDRQHSLTFFGALRNFTGKSSR